MRTALAYREQLQALLPPGAAWPRDEEALLTKLLHALGDGMASVDDRALDLIAEIEPATATELLPDWERALGLSGEGLSLARRRRTAARKERGEGGQSVPFFVELAAGLGFEVEVREFEPFAAGSRIGQPIYGEAWAFAFQLRALPPSEAVDPALEEGGDPAELQSAVAAAKPAHARALFAFPADPAPMLWFDFTSEEI